MKLFGKKRKKIMLKRDQINVDNLVYMASSGQISEINSIVLLELIRQLSEEVKQLKNKKR